MREKTRKILLEMGVSQKQIETVYIGIYKWWKQLKNPFYIIQNMLFFKLKKINKFEYELKNILLKNKEIFGDNQFYQSYPPLKFSGERDTALRVKNYNLKKYLNNSKEVLDIGGNTGFFSLYISDLVKHIDVVEYNQNLVNIGNKVKKNQKISNVEISCGNFLDFIPTKKYDIILSFAVHKWIGLDFIIYMEKLHSFLDDQGIVIVESQNLEIDPFDKNINKIITLFEIIYIGFTNENTGYKRRFAVLKKI